MYPPPSERFLPALVQGHRLITVVELHRTDGTVDELAHEGGSVTVDRGNAIRRTCSATVPDTSLIPRDPQAATSIYGARLRILRGIQYGPGDVETVPLGMFRIDSVGGDPDTGPVTIQGKDLSAVIADDKFTEPWTTRDAPAAIAAITDIIRRSLPDAVIDSDGATDATLGIRTWDKEADPWAAVQELATAIGAECYADADGVFVIAELPDILSVEPVWTVAAGEGGALIEASREFSRDGMFNVVVASGENTEEGIPPVSYTAVDDDPGSPTYYLGPFGRVPRFYPSAAIISSGQAQSAAEKLLRAAVKPNAQADITALPNPLLEPGDVIRVHYANGDKDLHQVQSFSVDLSPGGAFTLATIGGKEDA